ncbi:MAG TPA: UDP-glucose/GDP-mannose dehydrogenase family protein [Patescibacteria group bacterium]|nr:UDP-glucose/GDP-mannose dehydrogenase family protein [Patescibacteria group bacterium]
MTITFIGHGYVGLVTATVFADLGNKVWVVGHTAKKIEDLKKGITPFYEPGLTELVKKNIDAKRLLFTLDYDKSISESEIVFIAVGTPPYKTGDAQLSTVFDVSENIAKYLNGYTVVAVKSTVPPGTCKKVYGIIEALKKSGVEFDVASCPEFLREGTAILDTLNPDRIVIGTESKKAEEKLIELHKAINENFVLTNLETSELIKYASNSFLATKISFANAIAKLSELLGADGLRVLEGIGIDRRIGKAFLSPGPGYGGSCFPKDVKALVAIAKDYDYSFSLLESVEKVNDQAKRDIVRKVRKAVGELRKKKIGVLGLSFKPDTDDMRDAPAIDIIELMKRDGALIKAYDPQAIENAKGLIKDIEFAKDLYDCAKDAEALVVVTDWNEFKDVDFKRLKSLMKNPIIIDGRNIYDPEKLRKLGFTYVGVGR